MQQNTEIPLEGLVLVRRRIIHDERGFFTERMNTAEFQRIGLPTHFKQENHSRSLPGVLRGLHYQHSPAQGKLVGVVRGRIWDVAVDIRPGSATFGQHYGVEITDVGGELFWIPPGFAHGFVVLGDEAADVMYQTTAEYNAAGEATIAWDDPELAIPWPVTEPRLSDRDRVGRSFADYRSHPPEWPIIASQERKAANRLD